MFRALYTTNFFSILNDNYQKTLGMLVVSTWVSSAYKPTVIAIAGIALVLPYIFCSPIANRAMLLLGKQRLLHIMKLLEFPIVSLAVVGFLLPENGTLTMLITKIALVIVAIFLMGLQSSMYSPAKYGLIRDIGGVKNVSKGMGGMESISFLGMLSGTALAALAVSKMTPIVYCSLLIVFALVGYVASLVIKAKEVNGDHKESLNPFAYLKSSFKTAGKYIFLNQKIFILSIFWWFATSIQLCLIVYCQEAMGMEGGDPGIMLCIAGIGISIGCVASGQIGHRNQFEIQHLPFYGLVIVAGLIGMFLLDGNEPMWFGVLLFSISVAGGLFKIPLDTTIQKTVRHDELDSVLAYFNQVSFFFMLLASITYLGLSWVLPLRYIFILLALGMFIASAWIFFINRKIKLNYKS